MHIVGRLLASGTCVRCRSHTAIGIENSESVAHGSAELSNGRNGEVVLEFSFPDERKATHRFSRTAFGVYWDVDLEDFALQHFQTGNTIVLIGSLNAIGDEPFRSDQLIFNLTRST